MFIGYSQRKHPWNHYANTLLFKQAKTNQWHTFSFPPISNSTNHSYVLTCYTHKGLSNTSSIPNNYVCLNISDKAKELDLKIQNISFMILVAIKETFKSNLKDPFFLLERHYQYGGHFSNKRILNIELHTVFISPKDFESFIKPKIKKITNIFQQTFPKTSFLKQISSLTKEEVYQKLQNILKDITSIKNPVLSSSGKIVNELRCIVSKRDLKQCLNLLENLQNIVSSNSDFTKNIDILNSYFTCPISLDLIQKVCLSPSGHLYDQASIETWLKKNNTCPLTQKHLEIKDLWPCEQLQQIADCLNVLEKNKADTCKFLKVSVKNLKLH